MARVRSVRAVPALSVGRKGDVRLPAGVVRKRLVSGGKPIFIRYYFLFVEIRVFPRRVLQYGPRTVRIIFAISDVNAGVIVQDDRGDGAAKVPFVALLDQEDLPLLILVGQVLEGRVCDVGRVNIPFGVHRKGRALAQDERPPGPGAEHVVNVIDHANNSLRVLRAKGIVVPEEVKFVISNHMSGFSEDKLKVFAEGKRDLVRRLFACFNAADVFECGNNYYKQKGGYYKHVGMFEDPATTLKFMDPVVEPYIAAIGKLATAGKLAGAIDYSRHKLVDVFVSSGVTRFDEKHMAEFKEYLDKNLAGLSAILGENKSDILLRVPIEAIEAVGLENIKVFLNAFSQSPNAYVEFYNAEVGHAGVLNKAVKHMKMYGINMVYIYPNYMPWPVAMDKKLTITKFDTTHHFVA